MFKTSQDIKLKIHTTNSSDNNGIAGKYRRSPDIDVYEDPSKLFISPEITDVSRIEILHFPSEPVPIDEEVDFIIKRNGAKGNFEVKVEHPNNGLSNVAVKDVDPERVRVRFTPTSEGLYKVHIKCNCLKCPTTPLTVYIFAKDIDHSIVSGSSLRLPLFTSNSKKVTIRGDGIKVVKLNTKNEFIVDASLAGNNILFVGILGPKGPCNEVCVKHMGRNIYLVSYWVQDHGEYLIAAKWGDDHIVGSPFYLVTDHIN
ncbi:filamin-B [Condylostylus longicornis]|uniref:filamin-B n=1 Tax=Condylostylus longicornis TaxID=2530218 RepID=UPI00244E00ED|nr:filamin-B [Condylostylus longicornis]